MRPDPLVLVPLVLASLLGCGESASPPEPGASLRVEPIATGTSRNLLSVVTLDDDSIVIGGEGRTVIRLSAGGSAELSNGLPPESELRIAALARTGSVLFASVLTTEGDSRRYAEIHRLEGTAWVPAYQPAVTCLWDASLAAMGDALLGVCAYYPWAVRIAAGVVTENGVTIGSHVDTDMSSAFVTSGVEIKEIDPVNLGVIRGWSWSSRPLRGVVRAPGDRLVAYAEGGRVGVLAEDGAIREQASPVARTLTAGARLDEERTLIVGEEGTLLAISADGIEDLSATLGERRSLRAIAIGRGEAIAVGDQGLAVRIRRE